MRFLLSSLLQEYKKNSWVVEVNAYLNEDRVAGRGRDAMHQTPHVVFVLSQ